MSNVPGSATRRIFIDKQSPKAFHSLVQTSEAVRAVAAEAGLDRTLVELLNIRISQINGCAYCLDVHTRAALRAGDSARRLGVLAAWRDTDLFTDAERAALALAEATTTLTHGAAQESAYEAARQVLTDDQISAVIWVAITMNAFNRVSIMSKHPVRPERSTPPDEENGPGGAAAAG
ncbi:carboxymuconolactone decarboxylase family protein [Streptomyces litchfieldiae]|uniref:Carboxymuconolactone decarboxylase family protein n=1 Tax=Streptomyces litchfieldiae TaxID=3075543 RepID=A0ABU2MS75_9ACTN|nr:carboxymuconolactone decarboxylase family protein [Streptomyces sp. DSM 44938]MDT0344493.1 carboxymuconolactone decarboxylase family protein [Streptomyces sp. DSM 44938]